MTRLTYLLLLHGCFLSLSILVAMTILLLRNYLGILLSSINDRSTRRYVRRAEFYPPLPPKSETKTPSPPAPAPVSSSRKSVHRRPLKLPALT